VNRKALEIYQTQLDEIRSSGLWKDERIIASPQRPWIELSTGEKVLNLCANNYLGLSDHPVMIAAAKASYDALGYGLSSVRFICGTQTVHRELEAALAAYLNVDAAILYSSCFDANGGLFETLLTDEDAVISDALNHASIIDGIRLCRRAIPLCNNDMGSWRRSSEKPTPEAPVSSSSPPTACFHGRNHRQPKGYLRSGDRYGALVMVDDSHAVGFMGAHGRGTPEYCGVEGRVDILTGTWARRWAAHRAATPQPGVRSWTCCGSALGLSFFQYAGAGHRRSLAGRATHAGGVHSASRPVGGQYPLFPREMKKLGFDIQKATTRSRHHCSTTRASHRTWPAHAPERRLCHRLFLSGGAQGQSPHPDPDLSRSYARGPFAGRFAFENASGRWGSNDALPAHIQKLKGAL
jgi:hypothetical protein